ncbi:M1 family metallopeptidase [Streptomyces sp. URMC 123]|uniref:M1 family metallopeptidase n=1 Tax=Streptomyces sp. URMC 123 TaxID=3423403 RepID=UPI003F1A0449
MIRSAGRPPRSGRRSGRARVRRTAVAVTALAALVAATTPPPGALGIGDELFPHLGNPGYDVLAYDIALAYTGDNRAPLEAVTRISARATAPLRRLNLDFTRGTVRSVGVNGRPARFRTVGEDLVITPAVAVPEGAPARITVRHTSDPVGEGGGWLRTKDGLAMANQADAAHRVFPCNDHPSDKAMFTFRVTTPRGITAVTNGLPAGPPHTRGPRTTWTYRTHHPMATELAQVSIGRSAVPRRTGPGGLPLRDVVPAADRKALEAWLAKTPEQMAWLERRLGPYPFETYGLLVADARTGFELETQTLSLFERGLFTDPRYPEWYVDSIMIHELAHQWFGNSVSPARWSDLWLNEGHATWYEALYADEAGARRLVDRMREAYRKSDGWRAEGGPPAAPARPEEGRRHGIFRPGVYDGGALVLYALRQRVGPEAFEDLQRLWVLRHRDGVARTADFVDLACAVAGADLRDFLRPWLLGERTPPMPGHPDWRSDPPPVADGGRSPTLRRKYG